MLSPRWRKAFRDLWLNKARTILVVLAIAVGVFGVGSILTAYSILTREMNRNYMDTNPASAILTIEDADEALVDMIQNHPDVAEVETRRVMRGRIETEPGTWRTILLFVIDDFNNLRVNTFTVDSGAATPAMGEILIERAGTPVFDMSMAPPIVDKEVGDVAMVRTPYSAGQELRIAGITHDPGQAPSWMEGRAYGYITRDTAALLGAPPTLNELRVVVADGADNVETIRRTVMRLQADIENSGYIVSHIEIPVPGKHPHNDQMMTLLYLLEAFGVLAFVLSGVLVINMILALLARQIRQIGVMKSIGGRTRQIVGIYLSMVLILGALALGVGIPLGMLAGRGYAAFSAKMLNFEIASNSIPYWVYMAQIVAGLLMPAIAALYPIYRGSRITVQEAITDYGVSQDGFGAGLIDRLLVRVRGVGRIALLALRNTFRRQTRLWLTLGTLAAGGAMFMVAVNTGASWTATVDDAFDARSYDAMVQLDQPYALDDLAQTINSAEGVVGFEGWGQAEASLVHDDNTNSNRFTLLAPPAATEQIDWTVIEGRWLRPDDTNAIVVNHALFDHEPDMQVGREITLELNGQASSWMVVGMVREVGVPPVVYVNYAAFASVTDTVDFSNYVLVMADNHDTDSQEAMMQRLDQAFESAGINVVAAQTTAIQQQVLRDHMLIIVAFLLMMAVLVAVVGGLGLMSTMSLNVLERMREIGVMRAIGATSMKILQIVLIEGVFIGVLSWLVAVPLSIPLTGLVGNTSGQIFIQAPLTTVYSPLGIGIWFGLVVVIAMFASAFPALRAAEAPTHQVLAYE